jgi:hypothetical protein
LKSGTDRAHVINKHVQCNTRFSTRLDIRQLQYHHADPNLHPPRTVPRMPPKRKPSAPENRIYKSSTPLQQSRFPHRTARVKYGKQTSKRISKQETLTQMAFVNLDRLLDEDGEDLGIYDDETEKPKKKRRKTTGDSPSSESKYHTQTLTQIGNWSFSTTAEEDDQEEDVYDTLSSSPRSKELRRQRASEIANTEKPAILRSSRRTSAPEMRPPQTPHRRLDREIPCSESPATPPSRTSPLKRSALKERSINFPIPFNTNPRPHSSQSELPKLRVEDTFDSEDVSQQQPRIPTTPKRSSPAKSVRWADTDEIRQIDSLPSTEGEVATESTAAKSPKQLRDEIMDSEDDEDYKASEDDIADVDKENFQPETCYGDIGFATQMLLESQDRAASPCIEESQVLREDTLDILLGDKTHIVESEILGGEVTDHLEEEKSQYIESQRLATQHVRAMAPRTKNSDVFLSIRPENVTKIVDRTKNHEFRRQKIPGTASRIWIYETSPTRILRYMAVISGAKRPGGIEHEDGIGNVEFNAKDPNCGEFAWEILELYELADPLPWATIEDNEWLNGPPRKPTFVRPAVLDQLMANLMPPIFCRTLSAPELTTSSCTDTQEAEEQLLSNIFQYTQLQCTETPSSQHIKREHEENDDIEDDEAYSHEENDDGECEEEDFRHRTQDQSNAATTESISSSSQMNKHDLSVEEYPLPTKKPTQSTMAPPKEHGTQRNTLSFSQAETVDLSQSQTPRHHHSTADIIFESPTRPLFSSTPITLPTPREKGNTSPVRAESLVPYSMSSSQLLTKSQMLPESLLNDSVPGLPLSIQDSDEEDEL